MQGNGFAKQWQRICAMPAERSRTFSYFLLPAQQDMKVSYPMALPDEPGLLLWPPGHDLKPMIAGRHHIKRGAQSLPCLWLCHTLAQRCLKKLKKMSQRPGYRGLDKRWSRSPARGFLSVI